MRDSEIFPLDSSIPLNEEVLDWYLAGVCREDERQALEAWLRDHPETAARIGQLAYTASHPMPGMRQTTAAQAFEIFQRRRVAEDNGDRTDRRSRLQRIVRTVFAELTSRAVVALLGRKSITLTEAEIERLRGVVEQAETEDE